MSESSMIERVKGALFDARINHLIEAASTTARFARSALSSLHEKLKDSQG